MTQWNRATFEALQSHFGVRVGDLPPGASCGEPRRAVRQRLVDEAEVPWTIGRGAGQPPFLPLDDQRASAWGPIPCARPYVVPRDS